MTGILSNSKAQAQASVTQDSLNYLIQVYYENYQDQLNFDKTVRITVMDKDYDINLSGKLTQAPFLDLAPMTEEEFAKLFYSNKSSPTLLTDDMTFGDAPSTNTKVTIDGIDLTVSGTDITPQTLTVKAEIIAMFAVENSTLSLMGVGGTVTADGQPDPIVSVVLNVVCEILQSAVNNLPIPQIHKLGVDAQLDSAIIENNEIVAKFSATPDGTKEILLEAFEIPTDLITAPGSASIEASTGPDLANLLVEENINLPNFKETAEASSKGFGIRAEVLGGIQTPKVSMSGALAEGKTEIGLRATVGVKVFGKWLNIGVTPFNAYLDLLAQFKTDSSGKKVVLNFIPNFDTLIIDFIITTPGFLQWITHPIQKVLGKIVKNILAGLKAEIIGISITIFRIKAPLDICKVEFDWNFTELGIKDSKLEVTATAKTKV